MALALLSFKGSFYLGEFLGSYDEALQVALSSYSPAANSDFDASKNIFPHYKDIDLSFLKGKAVLIP
jgi:hypothetical protein